MQDGERGLDEHKLHMFLSALQSLIPPLFAVVLQNAPFTNRARFQGETPPIEGESWPAPLPPGQSQHRDVIFLIKPPKSYHCSSRMLFPSTFTVGCSTWEACNFVCWFMGGFQSDYFLYCGDHWDSIYHFKWYFWRGARSLLGPVICLSVAACGTRA